MKDEKDDATGPLLAQVEALLADLDSGCVGLHAPESRCPRCRAEHTLRNDGRLYLRQLRDALVQAQGQLTLYRFGFEVLRTPGASRLIDEILATTPAAMREAEARLPEIEHEAVARLQAALNTDRGETTMGKRREDGTWEDSCLEKLKPGEPFFVLRAQDRTAPILVEVWAELVEFRAIDEETDEALKRRLFAKVDEARVCAHAMRAWPKRKLPD